MIHERDGRTDRRTDRQTLHDSKDRACIASRGKNEKQWVLKDEKCPAFVRQRRQNRVWLYKTRGQSNLRKSASREGAFPG